ncbi:MAG: hypothetical protein J0M04_18615 [Verrucomicrobia bacterium]|nr:hypothetical protein [Verrucomicrobiota bacterium]
MIRRSFFQIISGLLLPVPFSRGSSPSSDTPACGALPFVPDPEWLREWHRIPRLEIREDDLPHHNDRQQRELAATILRHIRGGAPFAFRYQGGSDPGIIRRVLPTSLFCPDYFSHYAYVTDDPTGVPDLADTPIYFLGWCQDRNAPRTFRLDRVLPA